MRRVWIEKGSRALWVGLMALAVGCEVESENVSEPATAPVVPPAEEARDESADSDEGVEKLEGDEPVEEEPESTPPVQLDDLPMDAFLGEPQAAPAPAPAPRVSPKPLGAPMPRSALMPRSAPMPKSGSRRHRAATARPKSKKSAARRARDREKLAKERAVASARSRAREKDAARRQAERDPLEPRHDADDRFAEIRILDHSMPKDMTFYDYGVNPTISTAEQPVSTFAVDVDSASYGVARSFLQKGSMPAEGAIRVEEMINAFDYAYAAPTKEAFLVQAEVFPSPNRKGYHVLHVGVKGRELAPSERKPAALVFVIDVSGSMEGDSRLGLVKRSLTMLTRQLDGRDSVAIVVYGSDARTVLDPTRTTAHGKRRIIEAISQLSTEGSTNVEAGLDLGYAIAARRAGAGENSRVVLCSDGVANTGATVAESILARVKNAADSGVTISTVGFGMGTYNDVLMERLADKGNGNYAYVDNIEAAQRVFVEQLGATLEVIAKDVKIQVAFDDKRVARYRLLGFENRLLDKRDFDNDRVDAGEIGAGHTVTAIYEIKLVNGKKSGDIGKLRVRYKTPTGHRSHLVEKTMPASLVRDSYEQASAPTKLSMVVAAFAEKLRGSYWARNQSYADILALWDEMPSSLKRRQDVAELRSLIVTARSLDNRSDRFEPLMPVAKMDFDRVPVLY